MTELTPIMAQYSAIKAQYPDCLLFFRLGDFYELFFEDAKVASAALDIVLTRRNKDEAIPMCGVPVHAAENYIARLIKKGFRVALCEQMEAAPSKQEGKKKLIQREVVRIITAGTLVEDNLLDARCPNFLLAFYAHEQEMGLAYVDISVGDFFTECVPQAEWANALERLHPQEILVSEAHLSYFNTHSSWMLWKNKINALPMARFDMGEHRLASFFNVRTIQSFGRFSASEVAAAGALLDYVLLTQKKHLLVLSRPRKVDKNSFLEIDEFTRRNLEITQTFSGEKEGSLLHTIDRTSTAMGARILFSRLHHPLRQLEPLERRLCAVEYFVQRTHERRITRDILLSVPDVERALSRLIMGRGSPRDMGAVRTMLCLLPSLTKILQDPLPSELDPSALLQHEDLCQLLQSALAADLPAFLKDGGVIAPGYSPQLDQARHMQEQSHQLLQQLQEQYIQETQISSLRIRHNNIIGHYIEVSAAAASKVPFHFTLKQSLVSGCRYTSAELLDLENKIQIAREEAHTLEADIFQNLIQQLEQNHMALKSTIHTIGLYDVAASLAELACEHHYIKPVLDYSTSFSVIKGRHPVVAHGMSNKFIKNDCLLTEEKPIWLLTGPNMAGKSTFLRQNALIVLLAHIGSFVPAESACIGLVDRIFTRVGAADDLGRGRSTFMVEMIETATILNQATAKSFVIFDEVGRGTSTYDGLALAWAVLEHLAQLLPCRTLFATHYHELGQLNTLTRVAFYTLKVSEWEQNIVFFHEIMPGIAQKSYGIHVARLAGVPEAIVHRAEALLQEFEKADTQHVAQKMV